MTTVLEKKLKGLQGKEIVVVMQDNRSFRGTLEDFDNESLILQHVVEALPNNSSGWEEPTASTGIVHKVVTWQGVFSHADKKAEVVRLKDVIIRLSGVLRVWEWSMTNLVKPEHVAKADVDDETRGPANRVSRF